MKRALGFLLLIACKPPSDAAPPEEIALTTKAPMPVGPPTSFNAGDEVFCLGEDGRIEPEARVEEVGGLERGYRVHIGSGRFAKTEWLPATRVFAPPWVTTVKVGDTIYERRSGDFRRPKCVVSEVPRTTRDALRVSCDGEGRTRLLNRKDSIADFRAPRPGELKPGEIVYFKKWSWAMVVGQQADRVVIRETGPNVADKAVLVSSLEVVR